MNPILKWLGIALGTVVLLVAGTTALLYFAVDQQKLKATIVELANRNLNATLSIDGELVFAVLPSISVRVTDIRLQAPAGSGTEFASAKQLRLGARLLPLFGGELSVNELVIDGLRVHAERDANGKGNWETLRRADADPATAPGGMGMAPSEVAASAAAAPLLLAIDRVRIEDGEIDLNDLQAGTRYQVRELRFIADELNFSGDPFAVEGGARLLVDAGKQELGLALTANMDADLGADAIAITDALLSLSPASGPTLELKVPAATLAPEAKTLDAPEILLLAQGLEAKASAKADWSQRPEVRTNGRIDITKLDLPGIAAALGIGPLPALNPAALADMALAADYAWGDETLALSAVKLRAGSFTADGSLRHVAGSPARIEARLASPELDLDYLMPPQVLQPGNTAEPATTTAAESPAAAPPAGQELAALLTLNGSLEATLGKLKRGGLVMENLEAALALEPGKATLSRLKASAYQGSLEASGALDTGNGGALNLVAKLVNVDIKSLLVSTQQVDRMEGRVNGTLRLDATGTTADEWKATLRGPLSLRLDDAVLNQMSIEETVCKAAATLNRESLSAQFEPLTRFRNLEAALEFRNGRGEFRTLSASVPNMTLDGEGDIDLVRRKLDVQLNARITDDLAARDPACRMTRKMMRLEWPITCSARFEEPPKQWCGIDDDDLAKIATQLATEKLTDKIRDKLGDFFRR